MKCKKRENGGGLNMGWSSCELEWEGENTLTVTYFLVSSLHNSTEEESGIKYSTCGNLEMSGAQLMQRKVGHFWLGRVTWFTDGSKLSE